MFGCIFCGCSVFDALSIDSQDGRRKDGSASIGQVMYCTSDGFYITGVGKHRDLHPFEFPTQPHLRWDSDPPPEELIELRVMSLKPENGMHGFVFHDACWELFKIASQPFTPSLERLYRVCESLPHQIGNAGLNWGYEYGGILQANEGGMCSFREYFQWADIKEQNRLEVTHNPMQPLHPDCVPSDAIPQTCFETLQTKAGNQSDGFTKLPLELLQMILLLLPTQDALNLRLVSRAFPDLFSNVAFWASRFEPDSEKGLVFEARHHDTSKSLDSLMRLYFLSERTNLSLAAKNRRRLWGILMTVALLVRPSTTEHRFISETTQPLPEANLRLTSLRYPEFPFEDCTALHESYGAIERMSITPGAVTITVSILNNGNWDYLTGIKLVDSSGELQTVGYMWPQQQMTVQMAGLHGFRVGMGCSGVRALQAIGPNQTEARWMGRIGLVPCSDRLVLTEPVAVIEVKIDAFKIIALGIRSQEEQTTRPSPSTKRSSFRQNAIWFPNIPSQAIMLNEQCFTGPDPLSVDYQPMTVLHFGGVSGNSLKTIRGIQTGDGLKGMSIVYDDTHPEQQPIKMGCTAHFPSPPEDIFEIDGAGGERITSVSVGTVAAVVPRDRLDFYKGGRICYLMLTTNRERSMEFGGLSDRAVRHMDVAKGSTITGFYGYAGAEGIISLGVMSEFLDETLLESN